jgi:hypothetical protein
MDAALAWLIVWVVDSRRLRETCDSEVRRVTPNGPSFSGVVRDAK